MSGCLSSWLNKDSRDLTASIRARRTCLITRREGGRVFLRDLVGVPFGEAFSGPEDDVGAGVDDLDLDLTRERSIHWFSGGN